MLDLIIIIINILGEDDDISKERITEKKSSKSKSSQLEMKKIFYQMVVHVE